MVKIYMYGADEFLGRDISSMMSGRLAKIYQIKEEEILFIAVNSIIYHQGVDQTSYHLFFHVEAPSAFKKHEQEMKNYLLSASEDFSVHSHVEFHYEDNEVYSRIDEEYPLFVTEKNSVVVEAADEDDEENIDIFSEIK